MTHRLGTGNKIIVDRDQAILLDTTGQIIEISPRKAVVLVFRDAMLRGKQ